MSSLEDSINPDVFHQLISENASDLISILNNKYEYEYIIEKPYHDILGYSKEDLIGKNAWELVHPEDIKRMLETYQLSTEKFLGNQEVYKEELRIRHKNGHYIWIESHNKPFLNEQGEMRLFLISRDITDRRKVEQKLRESEKKYREAYERANLYKDLFSHDMSNIINLINGSIELYSMFKNRPEEFSRREDLLKNLSTSTNKAKWLISNVRTLSQIEEGVEISLENVDILKFLDEAIHFTHDSFHQREIPIKVDSPLDSIFVPSNALLLDVFENILNNAVKYNNNPIVEITVRISKEHEEGKEYIKMEFIDNGIGIPDERKNFIFQRGYSDIKGGKGLGFGLSVVKKVTELYNGKLWVEDRVEGDYSKGSNFIIVLPKEI
jgi:PAS domain S-box-containing protein